MNEHDENPTFTPHPRHDDDPSHMKFLSDDQANALIAQSAGLAPAQQEDEPPADDAQEVDPSLVVGLGG
jgi:hypothetical protein